MIRYLISSTALLSLITTISPTFAAEKVRTPSLAVPELKISGSTSFNSWFFNNKRKTVPGKGNSPCSQKKYGRGQLFTMDSARLKFAIEGNTDPGMNYGLVFVLNGDTSASSTLRENYLFFGGSWGRIYVGDTYGVASTMTFGGEDPLGGTGGFGGEVFDRVINYTTGSLHTVLLTGDTSRDTKFTYMTSRWNGFQAGMSYTPRSEHRGEQKINSQTSTSSPKEPFTTDNIASGINFIHQFDNGLEVALSGTSVFGKAHPEYKGTGTQPRSQPRRNVKSYAFGGTLTRGNLSFGTEYGNNGKSLQFKSLSKTNAGQFVDFGLSYTFGATKLSSGYYYSWRKAQLGTTANLWNGTTTVKSKTHIVSAAIDHKLAPGLGVYFEYAYYHMKNPAATIEAARTNANLNPCGDYIGGVRNNTANAFVVGSRLVF